MLNAVMAGKRRGTGLENQKQALGPGTACVPIRCDKLDRPIGRPR